MIRIDRRRRKYAATLLVPAIVVLASAVPVGCTFGRPPEPALIPLLVTPPGAAHTEPRAEVANGLTFAAKAVPAQQEELFFTAGGRVQAIYVHSGDNVAVDQILAVLDTRLLEIDRQAAAATLDLARQRLALAEATLRIDTEQRRLDLQAARLRLQQIEADPTATAVDRTLYTLTVRTAELSLLQLESGIEPGLQADVTRAELALRKIETALADARISASCAGQVLLYNALAEGAAVEPYTPVAAVVDPGTLVLEAAVAPADLQTLYEGMAVGIEFGDPAGNTVPGNTMPGTIRTLPQPFGTGTGPSTVIVPAGPTAPAQLRPGASVRIVAQQEEGKP